MHNSTLIILSVIAAVIFNEIQSQTTQATKQCQGIDLKISEEKMMNMLECVKDAGFDSFKDITADKLPCVFTCILKKRSIIDETGVLRKENIQQLINEDLPEEVRTDLNTRISACFDEHGSKLSPNDPMCSSPDLIDCIRTAYITVCKG